MKKLIFPMLLLAMLAGAGCNSGKPNTDDPKEFAKWVCEKSKEFQKLGADPVGNAQAMVTLKAEVEGAEEEFKKKHEADWDATLKTFDEAFQSSCSDLSKGPTGF